jgi:hypothetical protein
MLEIENKNKKIKIKIKIRIKNLTSFVRSITMDKWFDDQLKKMEVMRVVFFISFFCVCVFFNNIIVGRKRKGKNLL